MEDNLHLFPHGNSTFNSTRGNEIQTHHFRRDTSNFDSINLLEEAGLNFYELERNGIPHETFAEYIFTSGLILNPNLKWVAFNSAFDFGYLLKMISGEALPDSEKEFLEKV